MKTAFVAVAFAVSLAAEAQRLEVNYWGTVESAGGNPPRPVGELIHGSMFIDVSIAPEDIAPRVSGDPRTAWYTWDLPDILVEDREPGPPGGFVAHDGKRYVGPETRDYVLVRDGYSPSGASGRIPHDAFWVSDHEEFGTDYFELTVGAVGALDFIDGVTLLQDFDVRPDPQESRGFLNYLVDGVYEQLTFLTHRMRVKVCRP